MRRQAGFSVLELVLALAIVAMLLTAMLTFVFSMGEIWGHGRDRRLFEQHVDAVTRHVESLLRRASLPLGQAPAAEPFTLREVRTELGVRQLLTFNLPEGDRLLEWPSAPLPDVRCSLAADRETGLVLYWRSRLEDQAPAPEPRRTVVTPLLKELTYLYRDGNTGRWDTRAEPSRNAAGRWLVPDAVHLTFAYGGATLERTVTLPLGNGSVPVF